MALNPSNNSHLEQLALKGLSTLWFDTAALLIHILLVLLQFQLPEFGRVRFSLREKITVVGLVQFFATR